MSGIEERDALARELRERAHDMGGHPIALEAVKRSARRIQWRHRVASGVAAAVVLAVAVPAGLAVGHSVTDSRGPVGQPTPTVTPTPKGPVRIVTQGLDRGEQPQVAYFRKGDLVTPEGVASFPVRLQGAVRDGSGWLGLGYDGQGAEMVQFGADGRVLSREPSGESMVVAPDHSRLAYVRVADSGGQTLLDRSLPGGGAAAQTWHFPEFPAISPVAFVDQDAVLYQTEGKNQKVGIALPGREPRELEGLISASSASAATGLVAGMTSAEDFGSCWAVVAPLSNRPDPLWKTCDYSLGEFSPDGRFVLAGAPYHDGLGQSSLTILDARTGDVVADYQEDKGSQIALTGMTWEDEDTVLAIAVDGDTCYILRMGTDGRLEQAGEPVKGDPYTDLPLWFPMS
jgi:hypothetical protein